MRARTFGDARGRAQKPRNPQKPLSAPADQQRRSGWRPALRLPQKPAKPPQKCRASVGACVVRPAAADLCGTSGRFCGSDPCHLIAAGQTATPQVSADSAVCAAYLPAGSCSWRLP
jgi:hypothetical protein